MATDILMPALSPTMEEGKLAKWLKKEGDPIKSGDVLAEIETDKATMEVEAIDEGVLAKILVPEGTADVPVNDLIAIIAGEGEDPSSVQAGGAPKAASSLVRRNAAFSRSGSSASACIRMNRAISASFRGMWTCIFTLSHATSGSSSASGSAAATAASPPVVATSALKRSAP